VAWRDVTASVALVGGGGHIAIAALQAVGGGTVQRELVDLVFGRLDRADLGQRGLSSSSSARASLPRIASMALSTSPSSRRNTSMRSSLYFAGRPSQ
jgi:hypothetical protein